MLARLDKQKSDIYQETGAATEAARHSKLSLMERANDIEICSLTDAAYDEMNWPDVVSHMSKNIG